MNADTYNEFEEEDFSTKTASYICASCGREHELKPNDVVKCKYCGFRVLYKKRARELMQYEAR